jgi:hypothetical protein
VQSHLGLYAGDHEPADLSLRAARPQRPSAAAMTMDSGAQPGGQQLAVALLTGLLNLKR